MIFHNDIIDQIYRYVSNAENIFGLITFGSFGKKDFSHNSDIDLFLIVGREEDIPGIKNDIEAIFCDQINLLLNPEKNKIILYYSEINLKTDIIISSDKKLLFKYFPYSEIKKYRDSILIDKHGILNDEFLCSQHSEVVDPVTIIDKLTDQFIDSFEHASYVITKGDYYRFYFQYNIALAKYASLLQISMNEFSHLYLPRNLIQSINRPERDKFEQLYPTFELGKGFELLNNLKSEFCLCYIKIGQNNYCLNKDVLTISSFLDNILRRDQILYEESIPGILGECCAKKR
ncbi:nucleotidyltransferase domain-containing protein [Methanoplanus limicola]|uniref:DNA polymerase beta domain protein region n=1 Tax=Methanoplanus limicola DSM 2279 TaxID=937775 RepID=H1Z047_9EURY|nr:nucleotidyltransferase domain-containing protein [Methanoplanus limicola]EHQ36139.1 DNA polymerase beta domain protein region [Methanoplanus limicola DSM 2279]